jgi:hypothetical protein
VTRAVSRLLLLLVVTAAAQDRTETRDDVILPGPDLPITLQDPEKQVNQRQLAALYYAANYQVAAEIWPDKTPLWLGQRFRPVMKVVIGAKQDRLISETLKVPVLELKAWEGREEYFAQGVMLAARNTVISDQQITKLARRVMVQENSRIDVEELRK